MSTELLIQADDFELLCPTCNEPIESINVHRLWELRGECGFCYSDYQICITAEVA